MVAFYEKVADDEGAAPELRRSFARKANSLRILARLGTISPQASLRSISDAAASEREALLFSPTRLAAARIEQWNTGPDEAAELARTLPAPAPRTTEKASWMGQVIRGRRARSAAGG
jgi:hypothetical protein